MLYKQNPVIDRTYDPVNPKARPNWTFKENPTDGWKTNQKTLVCHCCNTSRSPKWFPEALDPTWSMASDDSENYMRSFYCIPCLEILFERFCKLGYTKWKALYRICSMVNCYYDDALARAVDADHDKKFPNGQKVDPRTGFVDLYLRAVAMHPEDSEKTFFDSNNFIYEAVIDEQGSPEDAAHKEAERAMLMQELETLREEKRIKLWDNISDKKLEELNNNKKPKEEEPKEEKEEPKRIIIENDTGLEKTEEEKKQEETFLSPVSREARAQVLQMFHIDPFVNESLEDKETMYMDLATMLDDAMADDLLRQKASVEVVRAFKRVDKISEAIRELQRSSQSIIDASAQLKALTEQKAKELSAVTQLAKDHGFTERYAMNKSKGAGTLSAIVREASESNFDPCTINKYDIETSEAIKQIADISAQSIINQLALGDNELNAMVKEQAVALRQANDDLKRTKEELRIVRESIARSEVIDDLKKELIRKKMPMDEVEEIVKGEWNQ